MPNSKSRIHQVNIPHFCLTTTSYISPKFHILTSFLRPMQNVDKKLYNLGILTIILVCNIWDCHGLLQKQGGGVMDK